MDRSLVVVRKIEKKVIIIILIGFDLFHDLKSMDERVYTHCQSPSMVDQQFILYL